MDSSKTFNYLRSVYYRGEYRWFYRYENSSELWFGSKPTHIGSRWFTLNSKYHDFISLGISYHFFPKPRKLRRPPFIVKRMFKNNNFVIAHDSSYRIVNNSW
jgi:hypothetical protein